MTARGRTVRAMGWLPDWPDARDDPPEHEQVAPLLARARVRAGLAQDWWTLIKAEWVDSGEFGL